MGVQRKPIQINWLASFALVVFAGCFYRVRGVNQKLFQSQVSTLLTKMGIMNILRPSLHILPPRQPYKKGQWELIRKNSQQFKRNDKIFRAVSTIENLCHWKWKNIIFKRKGLN